MVQLIVWSLVFLFNKIISREAEPIQRLIARSKYLELIF